MANGPASGVMGCFSSLLKNSDGGRKERKGFALSRSPTRKMIFLDL
jgi:hypothetical protein